MAEYVNDTDTLELRAAEQRKRLHSSMEELKSQLHHKSAELREKLDVKKNARQYFWPAAGGVGVLGLLMGYGVAAVFVK
jgi:RecJ-like exonuclease